jgi:hypothetical protein
MNDNNSPEWIEQITSDFKKWVEESGESIQGEPLTNEPPGLYSFYEELCALRNEIRTSVRRNHETLGKFGDVLADFEHSLASIRTHFDAPEQFGAGPTEKAVKSLHLHLIEFMERMDRLDAKLQDRPKKSIIGGTARWDRYVETFAGAISIVYENLEQLLKENNIIRIPSTGNQFDPQYMMAVEVDTSGRYEDGFVVKEFSPGYLHGDSVLKLAEVKVALRKEEI